MHPLSFRGSWSPPEMHDRACRGKLDFSIQSGIELEIEGEWPGIKLFETGEIPVIHGASDQGQPVTVLRAITVGTSRGGSVPVTRFHGHALLHGGHFTEREQFHCMSVFLAGLDDWLQVTGFAYESSEPRLKDWLVRYSVPESIPVYTDEQFAIRFGFGFNLQFQASPLTFMGLRQEANVTVEPATPQPLEYLMKDLTMMQRFVALATQETVLPRKVAVYVPDPAESTRYREATLFYQPVGEMRDRKLVPLTMLLPYPDQRERIPAMVKNWRESTLKKQACHDLYFGTLYNERSFLDNRFLNLAHACEAYYGATFQASFNPVHDARKRVVLDACPPEHQAWLSSVLARTSGPSFLDRLKVMLDHAGPACTHFIPDQSAFVRSVRGTRNRLVHQGSDPNHNSYQLYKLKDSLTWLLRCCFLRDLGFERDEVDHVVRRWFENNRWRMPDRIPTLKTGASA